MVQFQRKSLITSRNPDSPREKSVHTVLMKKFPGMVNTKTSKDTSASVTGKHLRILPCHQSITAGIMCTDSLSSYKTYANKIGVSIVQIKNGKFKEGIYHIQNINALHSNLRSWIQKFKGISTKYLANYLYWFKWLEFFKSEKRALKGQQLLIHAHSSSCRVRIKDFQGRGLVFI